MKVQQEPEVRGDARHALHAHVCRVGTRTGTAEQRIKAARHTVQGGVHGWESMGRLLRPGTCANITHIELRIEHRAPRLLPARCDADAWPCLDFQALGRRCGDDDRQPDSAPACIDPMHFSALYKKEPGRVGTLWAGKPAPGNQLDF